jgi:CheY-like chemotaxis protein
MASSIVVLVVEDDWMIREDVVDELRRAGLTVLETATAEGALELLQAGQRIDVLITDIQLAGHLSGWDVAERFRASHPDVGVIYASGNSVERARQVADSVFVSKPFGVAALVDACRHKGAVVERNCSFDRTRA